MNGNAYAIRGNSRTPGKPGGEAGDERTGRKLDGGAGGIKPGLTENEDPIGVRLDGTTNLMHLQSASWLCKHECLPEVSSSCLRLLRYGLWARELCLMAMVELIKLACLNKDPPGASLEPVLGLPDPRCSRGLEATLKGTQCWMT